MRSQEESYLQELMRDFSILAGINDVEQALQEINSRFLILEQNIEGFIPTDKVDNLPSYFSNLSMRFHMILYDQILSNAGQHRQANEPGGGMVLFGPHQKFKGTPAAEIAQVLPEVFNYLGTENTDPIVNAVMFYQRFVQVHPFYDANGRIGRLIVAIYLNQYGYYVDWSGLHRNNKWLKLLNECHERFGRDVYSEYLDRLVSHWRKHISSKLDLERLE